MKISSSLYALIVLCLAAPLMAGCNTIAGIGRDIESVGETVTHAAEDTSQGIATATNDVEQISPAAGTSSNAVYFGSGSAQLTPEGKEIVRAAATTARERNVSTIQVAGYADTLGPSNLNEGLSQRRAHAVAAELAAQGIPRDSIAVDWFGERTPPVTTGDGMSEAENRVATISLTSGLTSFENAGKCLYVVRYEGNMMKWHSCAVPPPMASHRL